MTKVTDTPEYQEWLAATLAKFPAAPGPVVARRLVDLLLPVEMPLARDARDRDRAREDAA